MPSIKSVSETEFDTEVLRSKTPVLVDFWAEWCVPCKALAPTLHTLAQQYSGVLEIKKVNIDENPAMRDLYRVRGIPLLALFVEGKEVARVTGARSRSTLSLFIDQHLKRESDVCDMTGGPTVWRAFDGDLARKAQCEQRLRAHIESKTIQPGYTAWNGKEGSALGCATERNDPEECARMLGLPTSMITFIDSLSTDFSSQIEAGGFVLKWLQALTPGVKTSGLPRSMVLCLLQSDLFARSVGEEASLREALQRVIEAHSNAGEEIASEADWAPIRQALREQRAQANGMRQTLLDCLHNASWLARDDEALREILTQICGLAGLEARDRIRLTHEEEREMGRLLNEAAKRLIAEGRSPQEARQLIEREMPERWKHFDEGMTGILNAIQEFGQQIAQQLIECTRALQP
jgi:thioredoxin